ncbi:MAG: hypothetical protein JST00_10765 [Deltaproteobacteria bacterium]|nr:hypothetical protein [Deltaproteobacteria bacterium]
MPSRRAEVAIAVPVIVVWAFAVTSACSSSTVLSSTDGGSTSGAGTSGLVVRDASGDEPLPKRRGAMTSSLTDHPDQREPCTSEGPFVAIGKLDPPEPVEDESIIDGLKARVSCTVAQVGGSNEAFDVSASIDFDVTNGRSMYVQGRITAAGDGSGVLFSMGKGKDTFASNSCRFGFGKAVHGVAAGRVWVEVRCSEIETVSFDQLCTSVAEIRFENCRLK